MLQLLLLLYNESSTFRFLGSSFAVDMITDMDRIHIDIVIIVVIVNLGIIVIVGSVIIIVILILCCEPLTQWTVVPIVFIITGYFFHKCVSVCVSVCLRCANQCVLFI